MFEPWIYSCETSREEIEAYLAQRPKHYRRKITARYGDSGLAMHLAVGGRYVGKLIFREATAEDFGFIMFRPEYGNITDSPYVGHIAEIVGRECVSLAYDMEKFTLEARENIRMQFSVRIASRISRWLALLSKGIYMYTYRGRKFPACMYMPLAKLPKYDYEKSAFRKFWLIKGLHQEIDSRTRRFLCSQLTQNFSSTQIQHTIQYAVPFRWRQVMDALGRSKTVAQFSKNLLNWGDVKTNDKVRWHLIARIGYGELEPTIARKVGVLSSKFGVQRIIRDLMHVKAELASFGDQYGGIWLPYLRQFDELDRSDHFLEDLIRIKHLVNAWLRIRENDNTHDPALFKKEIKVIAAKLRSYDWAKDKKIIVLSGNAARRTGKLMEFCLDSFAYSIDNGNYAAILVTKTGADWKKEAVVVGISAYNGRAKFQQCYGYRNSTTPLSALIATMADTFRFDVPMAEEVRYFIPPPFQGDIRTEVLHTYGKAVSVKEP